MVEGAVQRRLAAILAADVVGYSRKMGVDEAGTIAALRQIWSETFNPAVAIRHGRIVKMMGDGALVEFGSVVDAVACAVDIQRSMAARNADLPEDRLIQFRIGVNLGDVIIEGDDVFGDGVNVATRLEGIAPPGGVAVSGTVRDHLGNRLDIQFEDMGAQQLKNIEKPLRVYHVKQGLEQLPTVNPSKMATSEVLSVPLLQEANVGQVEPRFQAGWVDPEKQSIAVLPFLNMSGDPEQEYFSDGITEDIITELARFKDLFVISRNSSFHFKGRSVKAQEIGRELSAKYVVEGSVRKSGNRVRVTVQLIESASDNHVWAERYDRDLTDIFAVQDEVVRAIASAIPGQVSHQALEHIKRKPPENLTAYEYELRGRWAYLHWAEGLASATSWYEKAVVADSNYAAARSGLGLMYAYSVYVLGMDPARMFPLARDQVTRAIAGGEKTPRVHQQAAMVYHLTGERDLALVHAERALVLNPNDPMVLQTMGEVLCYSGRMTEALDWYARSAKIEPYASDDVRLDCICDTYYMLGQYEKVLQIHSTYQSRPAFLYGILAASLLFCFEVAGLEHNLRIWNSVASVNLWSCS